MELRSVDWRRTVFEIAEPWRLELDDAEAGRSVEIGGVGHAIVHYFQCPLFEVDVSRLGGARPSDESLKRLESRLVLGLLSPRISTSSDRTGLESVASSLRLDAREPFVYGYWLVTSDLGWVALRFDPTEGDERLLLHYRYDYDFW